VRALFPRPMNSNPPRGGTTFPRKNTRDDSFPTKRKLAESRCFRSMHFQGVFVESFCRLLMHTERHLRIGKPYVVFRNGLPYGFWGKERYAGSFDKRRACQSMPVRVISQRWPCSFWQQCPLYGLERDARIFAPSAMFCAPRW